MKYLFINSVYGVRSTGKLIASKCHALREEGHICTVAYGRESIADDIPKIQIGTPMDYKIHGVLSRTLDAHGLASVAATRRFLREVEQYDPDVIWLHNIHGYYLNYKLLFSWLKEHPQIQKFWTLHDCWAFTGHCAYFTMAKCDKWKTECGQCTQLKSYPASVLMDRSPKNYKDKKEAFTGVKNLTLITPSQWLADLTRESFLAEYPVQVVHNQIDKTVFCRTEGSFRAEHQIMDKFMVLGVAVGWEETKGLPDMLELRKRLDTDYVIVLVGVPRRLIPTLPEGIIGIERTENQKELAHLYTTADVFVNPTHQDNYPTVNLEARACGTPVITYDVGGSPESAGHTHIVKEYDVDGIVKEIEKIRSEHAK